MNERCFLQKSRRERYVVRDDVAPQRGFEPPQRLRMLRAADVPTRSRRAAAEPLGDDTVGGSPELGDR